MTMQTVESRIRNNNLILRQERAQSRVMRWLALSVFSLVLYVIGIGVWNDAAFVLLGGISTTGMFTGSFGFVVDLRIALQPIEPDETMHRTYTDAAPGQARLFVQDAPRHMTVGDLGIDNRERLMMGYTMERIGWKWTRDGVLKAARITNYSARFAPINEAMRQAGMVRPDGYIRDEFREWWTSPTPAVVDVSTADGDDDDGSSGRGLT